MPCWAAAAGVNVHPAAAIPFLVLLAAIALLPLFASKWWHSHRNQAAVALLLAAPTVLDLLLKPGGSAALGHGLMDYGQFIVLIGSLYVITGGIALVGDLAATPRVNTCFLAAGALLANVIGTTGASMLLIRPLLRTNRHRHRTAHLPIFFILTVSNCGGLLTPLGDPPLFLGFLGGVDFWWNLRLAPHWLLVNGYLLTLFYIWDRRQYRCETRADLQADEANIHPLRLYGWGLNGTLLLGVIVAVLAKKYITLFPLCELAMLACAALSWRFTPRSARYANHFTWMPMIEVAVLFAAIFITMIPMLLVLQDQGRNAPVREPWQFFWLTGLLSSGLDNAPTYLALAELAVAVSGSPNLAALSLQHPALLEAVSCGAVFMGANSYIGNGPNFMVKAIADVSGYRMPSFFGYTARAALILGPIYFAATLMFFR